MQETKTEEFAGSFNLRNQKRKRIAIIGNAGAGKSTLAKSLSTSLGINVIHLDQILWKPGWGRRAEDEFLGLHQKLLDEDSWIIEGWAYWSSIAPRFKAADLIVYIDLPVWLHYWRVLKRQLKYMFTPNPYLPENCPMMKQSRYFVRVVWKIHKTLRPQLLNLLREADIKEKVIYLRSSAELDRFLHSSS